ncbi:MAG TPA: hypothetical protein VFU69_12060, partial [Ktedonobacterales bacterium]|nr:hypothetical protein [Ktedonobacterales bacterium]
MLRRGKGRQGTSDLPGDDPSLQAQEDPRFDASGWEAEAYPAGFAGAVNQGQDMEAAPGEKSSAFSGLGDAAAPDAFPEAAEVGAAYYPADADDAYAAEDDEFAAEEEQEWDEDGQEEGAEEHALALYDAPQPPARRGIVGAMLLRLSGEGRELAALEPRATGPVLVPGSGKVARPGAFGHTLFSPRAHRPRPFLMIVFIIMLALMTVTAT